MIELINDPLFFWLFAGLLTLAAIGSALWPMLRAPNNEPSMDESKEATRLVLIDQIEEIKRDRDRGLMDEDEATNARAEVARRLLALDREITPLSAKVTQDKRSIYSWLMIVLIPLASVGFYSLSTTPQQTGQAGILSAPSGGSEGAPNAAGGEADLETLVAQVEAHLENNPNDQRGWQTLALVYQRQGKFDKAEEAFRKALALGGEDKSAKGVMQNGLGQVLVLKAQGRVSDEALALFREAQINEPRDATGFFYEALALSQSEKRGQAIKAWEALIAQFGQYNPPWLNIAEQTLGALKARAGAQEKDGNAATTDETPRGPNADDVENARNLSAEDRDELISSMVDGLAARLEENPDDLTGWLQLIRSYIVLDRKNDAGAALEKARNAFKDNPQSISALDAIAKENNL